MKVGDKIYCSKSWGGGTYWTITKGKSYTISELYDFHYKTEACIYIICDTGNKLVFMLNNSLPGVLYYNDYFSDRKLKLEKIYKIYESSL